MSLPLLPLLLLLTGVWMNFDTLGQILVGVYALDQNIVDIILTQLTVVADTFDTVKYPTQTWIDV